MRALCLSIVALLPLPAWATCPQDTFLSCPVDGTNRLEVCIGNGAFTYAFGPAGRPDLSLSEPMAAGTVAPWPGVGSAIWSSVSFRNGAYTYEVWASVDRNPDDANPQGGVNVLQGESMIAQRTCLPGTVTAPAFMLEDAMAAAGYCWNLDARVWGRAPCN
jgi:hypothetical protein